MKHRFAYLFLVVLSGCSVRTNREFAKLQKRTHMASTSDIVWQEPPDPQKILCGTAQLPTLSESLSRTQAVALALEQNPELQTAFEEIGVAKADLVQAGLFTNPSLEGIFRLPIVKDIVANIEIDAQFTLSDFWQVPIRKNIAQDELEIKTTHILGMVLDTIKETTIAYDQCVYEHDMLVLTKELVHQIQQTLERIVYRQQFGYESDFDRHQAEIVLSTWHVKLASQELAVKKAFIHLRKLLGTQISSESLQLTDQLQAQKTPLPATKDLESQALSCRPELQIAQLKIRQARHSLSYERARVVDDIKFGVSYKKDFDDSKGVGPRFSINVPLFDINYAQIRRTQFLIRQAKKELKAQQLTAFEQVHDYYQMAHTFMKEQTIYVSSTFPAAQGAIEYASHYFDTMQINMLKWFESCISLYELKQAELTTRFETHKAVAHLERAIGKKI